MRFLFLSLVMIFLLVGCQEGLSPLNQPETAYISGSLIVISGRESWPSPDSALELRVVAFKDFPPKNIINEIVSGNAYFTDTLHRFNDTISFVLKIDNPPVRINYLAGALRYGTILDWKVLGFYTLDGKNPQSLFLNGGDSLTNIKIFIDFYNLPPQPFGVVK
ncbi:MAG: hypothetical protein ACUVQ1_05410 [Candidatus Kapaibacteriales bacterium]